MMTGSAQFRYHPDDATLFKIYGGYDHTDFPIMKVLNVDCSI